MTTYTMAQAAVIVGKSENHVRDIVKSGKVRGHTEVKGKRSALVVDDDGLTALCQLLGVTVRSDEPHNEEVVTSPALPAALGLFVEREDVWQSRYDALANRLAESERERGRLEGENASLRSKLHEFEVKGEAKRGIKWFWER